MTIQVIRRRHLGSTFMLAAAGWSLATLGCGRPKPPDSPMPTVRGGLVQELRPAASPRYSAAIQPSRQVNLAFKSAGIVDQIYQVRGGDGRWRNVESGDGVAGGTELAQVRRLDYEQRVEQARDQLRQSQAALAQSESTFRQAELDHTRASNLYQSESLIKPEYDQAQARYDGARAQVDAAHAAVAVAQDAVSQANLALDDTVVRAPFGGLLASRSIERGALAGNTTVGFVVVDIDVVKATFAVPDSSLAVVRMGQHLEVTLDALSDPVSGVVTSIGAQADPRTHVFPVEVSLPNPGHRIRPGMIGSLTLGPIAVTGSKLVVPLSAIVQTPDRPGSFAVLRLEERGGKSYVAAQQVSVGQTFGSSIEVTSGVRAADRIVTVGGELVSNGQEVRVLP